jgi:hypothetical protein
VPLFYKGFFYFPYPRTWYKPCRLWELVPATSSSMSTLSGIFRNSKCKLSFNLKDCAMRWWLSLGLDVRIDA